MKNASKKLPSWEAGNWHITPKKTLLKMRFYFSKGGICGDSVEGMLFLFFFNLQFWSFPRSRNGMKGRASHCENLRVPLNNPWIRPVISWGKRGILAALGGPLRLWWNLTSALLFPAKKIPLAWRGGTLVMFFQRHFFQHARPDRGRKARFEQWPVDPGLLRLYRGGYLYLYYYYYYYYYY